MKGPVRVGDILVCGSQWGRVRALVDERQRNLPEAGPAVPVEVLGLGGIPAAGDAGVVVENERRAREVTSFRQERSREQQMVASQRGTLEQMFSQMAAGELKELPVVIKGDVQGSVEALLASIERLNTDE